MVEAGITHIDTSDFYGPHVTNELIRDTLHPYAADLHLVTKVGTRRTARGSWPAALAPEELRSAVEDNLTHLGVEALDVVNLRMADARGNIPAGVSVAEPFGVLAELRQAGKIRHLGLSNVDAGHLAEAQQIAPVVCVQNSYNLAHRDDDPLVDVCATQGIAFVPFFPLGGHAPLQSEILTACAQRVGATTRQVALAWLLHRSPTILLIPGTSSVAHLGENVAAGSLDLPADVLLELEGVGG